MATVIKSNSYTITLEDDLVWGESLKAGTTLTLTVASASPLGAIDFGGGGGTAGVAISEKFSAIYNGVTYTPEDIANNGAVILNGETSVTLTLVVGEDYDLSGDDILQMGFDVYNEDYSSSELLLYTIAIDEAPENIALSASAVDEAAAVGTIIGALSATDAEGDALTYTLDDDANGLFKLVTTNGVTSVALNGSLESSDAPSYDIVVQVSDGENEVEQKFTIDVARNTAPADISISNATVKESARVGFVVGTLSATDAEGDAITWSLESGKGDNDDKFKLVTNNDGSVSVVLKAALDHESSGGVYDLVVTAKDSHGAKTTQTIAITAAEEHFKLSSSPTGYDYLSVTEAAGKGQELGYVMKFDDSFVPVRASLTDNGDGAFSLKTRVVDGETRYYLVTNKTLDYEKKNSYSVAIEVENAAGETLQKTFDVKVLDAVETGDPARGKITIDANTLAAGKSGGVNWNSYLDDYWAKLDYFLPNFSPSGTGWSSANPSSKFIYGNGDKVLSMQGSLAYVWNDPATGEDVHVVAGSITDLVFGSGSTTDGVKAAELKISGLDLKSGSTPINRLTGEVNLVASAFMHGPDEATPAEFAYVKALLASYAQSFVGSSGADTYTGTIFGDTVKGNGGNDTVKGGAGNDVLYGDAGNDTLSGDAGNDRLSGGDGADTLKGGTGKDTLSGSAGNDKLYGGDESDTLSGGSGNDTLYGEAGDDDLNGGSGDDLLQGGAGKDKLAGSSGKDRIYGGDGADTLAGDAGDDKLYGEAGDDKLSGGDGADALQGGAGKDTLSGGSGNDKLYGDADADRLSGGSGADTLSGGDGADRLTGGSGADKLYGGKGADVFIFTLASESAGKSYDTIYDFTSIDTIDLSAIDANTKKTGNQAFIFIGDDDFSRRAGELRFEKIKGDTVIEGDRDGNGKADFILHLDDSLTMKTGYFDL